MWIMLVISWSRDLPEADRDREYMMKSFDQTASLLIEHNALQFLRQLLQTSVSEKGIGLKAKSKRRRTVGLLRSHNRAPPRVMPMIIDLNDRTAGPDKSKLPVTSSSTRRQSGSKVAPEG